MVRAITRFVCLVALLFAAAAATWLSAGAQRAAAASEVTWTRFDVTVDVREDGSIHVTERQEIRFESRGFTVGFATIPLERVDDIRNITLSEERDGQAVDYEFVSWSRFDDDPGTYSYDRSSSQVELTWGFPSTRNASRTFLIEYDLIGAIRVSEDENGAAYNQIWMTAIAGDVTEIGDVLDSTVTIRLPRAVDPARALLGEDAEERPEEHTADGQTWVWTRENLETGDEFVVRLEVPAVVSAGAPGWQSEDDEQRLAKEQQEDRRALYNVVFLAIGLLSAVVAGAGLYGLWYTKGRDPHVGLVAEFLPEPPDDLPPGAAGALVDEVAHERDIVATIVDLGRKGVIKIDEQNAESELPVRQSSDFTLTLLKPDARLTAFERQLLEALFGANMKTGASEQLGRVKSRFTSRSGAIRNAMYAELVRRGYFTASPEATRGSWKRSSTVLLIGAVLLICVGGGVLADLSPFVFLPLAVLVIFALALRKLSPSLPRKSRSGAEAAAKWRAFRRYLSDIEKYDKVKESRERFDKYLPYAVAFGLESSWVNKFAAAGAAPELDWFGPTIFGDLGDSGDWTRPRRQRRGGTWVFPGESGRPNGGGGSGSDWDFDIPDLQDMSDSAGRKLQGGSNSFFDMLASAAEAFGDFSSSGGGGRRHWGGGGGFRGGGSRGGSFGGGSRGFR
jgi:hypothetical protein